MRLCSGARSGHRFISARELRSSRGFGTHRANFIFGVAQAVQDLRCVFAEEGRRQTVARGSRRKVNGIGDAFGGAYRWMFELDNQASCLSLRGADGFSNGVDGRRGNFCGCEFLETGRGGLSRKNVLQPGHEDRAVLDAFAVGLESRIGPDFALYTEGAHKLLPQHVGSHSHDEISVIAATKNFIRDDVRMSIAAPLWGSVGVEVTAADVREPRQLRVKK